jgi:hypothetical protein
MKSYLGDTGPEGESIKSARPRAKPAASFNLVDKTRFVLTLSTIVRAIVSEACLSSASSGRVRWPGVIDEEARPYWSGRPQTPGRLKGMDELGKVSRRTALSQTESPSGRRRKAELCSMRLSEACLPWWRGKLALATGIDAQRC